MSNAKGYNLFHILSSQSLDFISFYVYHQYKFKAIIMCNTLYPLSKTFLIFNTMFFVEINNLLRMYIYMYHIEAQILKKG